MKLWYGRHIYYFELLAMKRSRDNCKMIVHQMMAK